MIKVNELKVTPNEYAKIWLDKNLGILEDNVDFIMKKNPVLYESFTPRETKEFKIFVGKRIKTIRNTLGIAKLKDKLK